jgi:putative addiction module antidote
MNALTVRRVGNSLGVILPRDLLAKFEIAEGDKLFVSESQGGMHISRADPVFEQKMEAAQRVMHKRYAALRELAK